MQAWKHQQAPIYVFPLPRKNAPVLSAHIAHAFSEANRLFPTMQVVFGRLSPTFRIRRIFNQAALCLTRPWLPAAQAGLSRLLSSMLPTYSPSLVEEGVEGAVNTQISANTTSPTKHPEVLTAPPPPLIYSALCDARTYSLRPPCTADKQLQRRSVKPFGSG